MSDSFVYGLIDPETQELRYIGKTTKGMKRFAGGYRAYAAKCRNWIRSLEKKGLRFEVVILEETKDLNEAECRLIAFFRKLSYRLTNMTDGGEGAGSYRRSDETRRRIGLASKGRIPSEETRRKLSQALLGKNKGKKLSDEHKARLSEMNRLENLSVETIAKRQASYEARRGSSMSAETKAKMKATQSARRLVEKQEVLKDWRCSECGIADIKRYKTLKRCRLCVAARILPSGICNGCNETKSIYNVKRNLCAACVDKQRYLKKRIGQWSCAICHTSDIAKHRTKTRCIDCSSTVKPTGICVICGDEGKLESLGKCNRCYKREWYRTVNGLEPKSDRRCQSCDLPITSTKRPDVKYCSKACGDKIRLARFKAKQVPQLAAEQL